MTAGRVEFGQGEGYHMPIMGGVMINKTHFAAEISYTSSIMAKKYRTRGLQRNGPRRRRLYVSSS